MAVAQITREHLTLEARAEAERLLAVKLGTASVQTRYGAGVSATTAVPSYVP